MKKTGAKIKHHLALKPLGCKSINYELNARAALLAIKHNVFTEAHLVDLYALADITALLSDERYIQVHSSAVKNFTGNLVVLSYEHRSLDKYSYISLESSVDMLLEVFRTAKNADIARICLELAK